MGHFRSSNPRHPWLNTHVIDELSVLFGIKIFEAYLENNTPAARRMFWVYGPDTKEITPLAVEHQPDPNKKHAYKQIRLSSIPGKAGLPPAKKTQKSAAERQILSTISLLNMPPLPAELPTVNIKP